MMRILHSNNYHLSIDSIVRLFEWSDSHCSSLTVYPFYCWKTNLFLLCLEPLHDECGRLHIFWCYSLHARLLRWRQRWRWFSHTLFEASLRKFEHQCLNHCLLAELNDLILEVSTSIAAKRTTSRKIATVSSKMGCTFIGGSSWGDCFLALVITRTSKPPHHLRDLRLLVSTKCENVALINS